MSAILATQGTSSTAFPPILPQITTPDPASAIAIRSLPSSSAEQVAAKPLTSERVLYPITPSSSVLGCARVFTGIYGQRGYNAAEAKPLSTADETLTYVNSSIAIFKGAMLRSEEPVKQFVIQPCFRHRASDEYVYLFNMLGAFTDISCLPDTFADVMHGLEAIGLKKNKIHIIVNQADTTLMECSTAVLDDPSHIHTIDATTDKYSVTWKFGQPELNGKGLTFVYKLPGPDGDINHPCYVPLGNIIIVTNSNSGKQYVDVGFGIECVVSCFYEGTMYKIPFYQRQVDFLIGELALNEREARQMVKCLHGILFFQKEGIVSSNKGAGYILKRLFRDLLEILDEHSHSDSAAVLATLEKMKASFYPLYELEEQLSQASWNSAFAELAKQATVFFGSLDKNSRKAEQKLQVEKGTEAEKTREAYTAFFKGTLGLTDYRIQSIFSNTDK